MACVNEPVNEEQYGLANLLYLLSKIWEWGDTYFLVLTGKPVIFLHFFHHMTTFTMAALTHNFPVGGYCFINCAVHVVMYAHYAFPVRWARWMITSFQLLQFVAVISIHSYGYLYGFPSASVSSASADYKLCYDMSNVQMEWWYCQLVVVGYFVLFVNFFMQQYVKKPTQRSKDIKQI